jgi:hypothetical protein
VKVHEIDREFRRQIKDQAKPYLISAEQSLFFLNQAQREAARRARLLVDSTTDDVARYAVAAGEPLVTLSAKVISIRRARLASSARPLTKRTVRQMDEEFPGWDGAGTGSQPFVLVVDYQTDAAWLYPAPQSADTLLMTVTREPLKALADDDDQPETAPRYDDGLIEWMKYRAYLVDDVELYDPKQAAHALARFSAEFGEAIGAINERFDAEHYDDDGER